MSVVAPAFIEGNNQPDRQYLCRMQMVLSGPALYRQKANPSLSPSLYSSPLFLPPEKTLLHNYLISSLLKQLLDSEHSLCIGAGPFTPNPPLSLNAPFVSFIITIQKECHTLPNEQERSSCMGYSTAQHRTAHSLFPDCKFLVISRRNHNHILPHNCD